MPRPWVRRDPSRRLTRWPTSFGRTNATIKVYLQSASFASRLFIVAYGNLSSGWRAQAIVSVAQEQGAGSATSWPVVGAAPPAVVNLDRERPAAATYYASATFRPLRSMRCGSLMIRNMWY